MLSTSTTTSQPPLELVTNLHYQRRWLLQTNFYHPQPAPPDVKPDPSTHPGFDTNLAMVLAVLLCALVCSLCVNSLIRCVLKCSSFIIREPNYYINRTQLPGIDVGLDKRALRTFPIVKYSKDVKIQGLEKVCAICLSEFRKAEKLRILPKCNHGFHVKCVDKWLKCHSSCPTCRQYLIDTCQKITTSDNHIHQIQGSSSSSVPGTGEVVSVSVSVLPLEREDLVRNYRG